MPSRDLARNEEFSEIAVINIFFTVLKTKTQLSVGGGGPAGEISRYVTQLTCKQTRRIQAFS